MLFATPLLSSEHILSESNSYSVALYDPTDDVFHPQFEKPFRFGPRNSSWKPLSGYWYGDGITEVALYDPAYGVFHPNEGEPFRFGPRNSNWLPIAEMRTEAQEPSGDITVNIEVIEEQSHEYHVDVIIKNAATSAIITGLAAEDFTIVDQNSDAIIIGDLYEEDGQYTIYPDQFVYCPVTGYDVRLPVGDYTLHFNKTGYNAASTQFSINHELYLISTAFGEMESDLDTWQYVGVKDVPVGTKVSAFKAGLEVSSSTNVEILTH